MTTLTHVTLPVLGIPTRFESDAPEVIEIVEEAFGWWRDLADAPGALVEREEARVHVAVVVGGEGELAPGAHAPIQHELPDATRLVVRSAGSVGVSVPERREAVARVSTELVADRMHFRTEVLETLTLALLSAFDRHPVHAAAVAEAGHALLLAAPSGTGKSTLAYACHVAGLDLLGDDHVRVQLEPALRIWGWPARVRLLPETARRLGVTDAPVRQWNGKRKSVVDATSDLRAAQLLATDATVCVLARDGGPLSLTPLSEDEVQRALEDQLTPGFDRFPARWPAVKRALAARGGWRLNLSADPQEAVPVVRELLAGVTRPT